MSIQYKTMQQAIQPNTFSVLFPSVFTYFDLTTHANNKHKSVNLCFVHGNHDFQIKLKMKLNKCEKIYLKKISWCYCFFRWPLVLLNKLCIH